METFKEFFVSKTIVNLRDHSSFDSSSLFNEMAVLTPNAINKTQSAMQFIHDNKISGVIIGGIAVSHYSDNRALTPDVDFLTSEISSIKLVLQKKGIAFQPLASNGEFGGIYVPKLDADFLDADEGNAPLNHYILKTAVSTQIGGVTFPIINNAVLTIMKFIIGRDKDTSDAFKLLKTVPKEELKTHLKNLKSYLPEDMDAKTIWSYAKAIGM